LRRGLAALQRRDTLAEAMREQSKQDILKAYELDPVDESVALTYVGGIIDEASKLVTERAQIEQADTANDEAAQAEIERLSEEVETKLAQAEQICEQGVENHPSSAGFFRAKATIAGLRRDNQQTLAEIDAGLDAIEGDDILARWQLEAFKVEMLLQQQEIDEAGKLLNELRKSRLAQRDQFRWQLDRAEARIMLAQGRWYPAKGLLENLRKQLPASTPDQRRFASEVDFFLGMAYEKLGQQDLAEDAYSRSLRNNADNKMAEYGLQRVARVPIGAQRATNEADQLINNEVKKPRDQRNWQPVLGKIQQLANTQGWSTVQKAVVMAQIYAYDSQFDKAQAELDKVFREEPDNLPVWRQAIRIVASNPDKGPVAALKLLDRAASPDNFGDLPVLRLDRGKMYLAIGDDDLEAQLMALTDNTNSYTSQQKIQLLQGVGELFALARNNEAAEKVYRDLVAIAPDDLASRTLLFRFALARGDDDAMKEAQKGILGIVKSERNPTWQYTEAARLLSRYRRDLEDKAVLSRIKQMLAQIREPSQRPDWADPYILAGEVALLEKDFELAIENLGKGIELGARQPLAAVTYINLLTERGRYFQAREAIEAFDEDIRQQILGRLYPEILLNTNAPAEAIEAATQIAIAKPEDAATQLWYGMLLQKVMAIPNLDPDLLEQASTRAGAALAKVVEVAPSSQEGWYALITHLLGTKQLDKAEQALRDAQLNLPEDIQTQVLAQAYSLVGRWFDAENKYLAAYEANPEEPRYIRALTEFYLSPRYPKNDKLLKATKLINAVIQMGADGKLENNDPNLQWARRRAATLYASSGSYQDLLTAEKLLASNAEDNLLNIDDKLELAKILSRRPEMVSRRKAITLLEEVRPYRLDLPLDYDSTLAKLYFAIGNWPKARDLMNGLITKNPDVPQLRQDYIRMLLQRGTPGDIRTAAAQVQRLQQLAPGTQATIELMALVADKAGEVSAAQEILRRQVDAYLKQKDEQAFPLVLRIAELLTQLDDTAGARKIYEALSKLKADDPRYQLALAGHLGRTGNADEAFAMLDEIRQSAPMAQVIQTGQQIVRAARDKVGDKYDARVMEWLDRELREDPNSIPLQLQRAELLDLVGRYEDAAEAYRKLLSSDDLVGTARAVALNNLAYLLVLGAADQTSSDEATKLVNEAVSILGPSSEILDTRAVLEIARGNHAAAITDLESAIIDSPTASKHFHLTQALLGAGNNREAIVAWDKAIELGLEPEEVNRLEMPAYEKTAARIEQLKQQTGSL
jgi:Tfp pilus assembly protein PilF